MHLFSDASNVGTISTIAGFNLAHYSYDNRLVMKLQIAQLVFGWGRLRPYSALHSQAGCIAGLAIFDTIGACVSVHTVCKA